MRIVSFAGIATKNAWFPYLVVLEKKTQKHINYTVSAVSPKDDLSFVQDNMNYLICC